jgi:hypothetical protein
MMRRYTVLFLVIAATYAQSQELKHGHDVAHVTDVSVPQPDVQVISTTQVERIATQKQALDDISDNLKEIKSSLDSIKADIRVLQDTNVIVNFLLGGVKLLIPGIIIAWFGLWYSDHQKKSKAHKGNNILDNSERKA